MEQIIIQDCGCIALPEGVATTLDLRRGLMLDVALKGIGDTILLTAHRGDSPTLNCVILLPSR